MIYLIHLHYYQKNITNMETTKDLTLAEKSLYLISTIVLILGIIGALIVFFTSCISWEISYSGKITGFEGVNWINLPSFAYVIMATLISWSLLSIIAEIAINVRLNGINSSQSWQKEFALLVLLDKKAEAKEILYKAILDSKEFKAVLSGGREEYHVGCIETLNKTYSIYLNALGESTFDFDNKNELFKIFK